MRERVMGARQCRVAHKGFQIYKHKQSEEKEKEKEGEGAKLRACPLLYHGEVICFVIVGESAPDGTATDASDTLGIRMERDTGRREWFLRGPLLCTKSSQSWHMFVPHSLQ